MVRARPVAAAAARAARSISVGNLRVGGSGKTPLVAIHRAAAARARRAARDPHARLRRGACRATASPSCPTATRVLADRRSRRRRAADARARAAGRAACWSAPIATCPGGSRKRRLGATVHLLDDGFQHLELCARRRSAARRRGRSAGPAAARRPAARARSARRPPPTPRSITAGYDTAAERIGRALGVSPVVSRDPRASARRGMIAGARDSVVVPSGSRVFVVAGIARPDRFVADICVGRLGDRPASIEFRDHHLFTARDVDADRRRGASAAGSALVLTTEKDAVRLAACDLGDLPIASVPLVVGIEPADAFRRLAARSAHAASRNARPQRRIRNRPHSAPAHPHPQPQSATMRHRLEYLLVRALIALVRVMPGPLVRAGGSAARPGVLHARPRAPPDRAAQPGRGVSRPDRRRSGARSPARAFAHFGRLLFELLKFSTLSPRQMLARVEFDGEERARARLRAGQGRAVRHRAFRVLGAAGDGARAAASSRSASWRARSTTRTSTGCSSASASAPATRSSTGTARSGA